jgi:hypothetical protein
MAQEFETEQPCILFIRLQLDGPVEVLSGACEVTLLLVGFRDEGLGAGGVAGIREAGEDFTGLLHSFGSQQGGDAIQLKVGVAGAQAKRGGQSTCRIGRPVLFHQHAAKTFLRRLIGWVQTDGALKLGNRAGVAMERVERGAEVGVRGIA